MDYSKVLVGLTVVQIVLILFGEYMIVSRSGGNVAIPAGMNSVKVMESDSGGNVPSQASVAVQSTIKGSTGNFKGHLNPPATRSSPANPMIAELEAKQKYLKIKLIKGFKFAKTADEPQCSFAVFFQSQNKHYFELGVMENDKTCKNASTFTPIKEETDFIQNIILDKQDFKNRFAATSTCKFSDNDNKLVASSDDKSCSFAEPIHELMKTSGATDEAVTKFLESLKVGQPDSLKVVIETAIPKVTKIASSTEATSSSSSGSSSNVLNSKQSRLNAPVTLGFVAALKVAEDSAGKAFQYLVIFRVKEGYFIYRDTVGDPEGDAEFINLESPAILTDSSGSGIALNMDKYEEVKLHNDEFQHLVIDGMNFYARNMGFKTRLNINETLKTIANGINGDNLAETVFGLASEFTKMTTILIVPKSDSAATTP